MKIFSSRYWAYEIKKNLRKEIPRWFVLLIDLYATLNTFLISFIFLKLIGIRPDIRFYQVVVYQLPIVLFCALIAFLITSSYKGIIRHTGFKDVLTVFYANLIYVIMMALVQWFAIKTSIESSYIIGKVLILVHFFFNTLVLVLLRIFYKGIYDNYVSRGRTQGRKVMIYGAGESGVITYNALKNDERGKVSIFGFLDDKKQKQGKKIDGVRIYNPKKVTPEFIEKHQIDEIIISIQNIKGPRLREIVDRFTESHISLKIVPAVSSWLNGDLTVQQIQPVKVEDLLGRETIELDKEEIIREVRGKTIMVTGAAGSIGSEIARQLMRYPCEKLILIDQAESPLYDLQQASQSIDEGRSIYQVCDIRNQKKIDYFVQHYRPQLIFHAAAYKHVPLMEESPCEAAMTNIKGTKHLADAAIKHGVEKFVLISTDKAVNPTNVMGATKRVAELYVTQLNQKSSTNFIVTRFGNVLGSNGSVIPLFRRQIQEGGPLTVTHPDITRYFMTIPEACQLVLEAGAMGGNGEIFVFDMGKPVKIFDLAIKIIQLSGLNYPNDIDIKITGLRPGEKIFEELLADDENSMKTHHPKIMIAKVNPAKTDFDQHFKELMEMEFNEDMEQLNLKLVKKIKALVPEYISQNSIFCAIDEQTTH